MARIRRLSNCHNIADLRALAARRLPRPIFDYLDGAAEDEVTAARNIAAFDGYGLIPNSLVDVTEVDTTVTLLGQKLAWPVLCSPAGMQRMYHPLGELAAARAAASAGTLYGVSVAASQSLERVAAASAGPKMFQLYIFKNCRLTLDLIERCREAGYAALCLTVDSAVRGNRERELRTGLGIPLRLSPQAIGSFAAHPAWLWSLLRSERLVLPNLAAYAASDDLAAQTRFIDSELDASVSWQDVGEIIAAWGGPFAIKGIMAPRDAERAARAGASAIIVSNHGGRQLDGAAAPLDVLPAVVDAAGGAADIVLESGVRRGSHVLKALALGASACSIGRPYLYGLAAGGEAGAERALSLLRRELVRAMQLCGCTRADDVNRDLVCRLAT